MPVPKKRHSNVRQGKRRFSNYRLSPAKLSTCPSCGAALLPHHACPSCGTYKGRQVKKIKEKKKGKGKE
ncbi:MAG: 50S ribosomal protein L32 [Candidatus Margulisbacteria bacterium]|nr:50S ribosomal protein L32 [Candidatus Margulisiibacteriota bacterium]